MKEMHTAKKTLIFTTYDINEPVADFSIQAETYVFSGRRWAGIYVNHIPSGRVSSRAIVPYRDIDIEQTIVELIFEAIPRDEVAYLDRMDRYFSEEIVAPEE